MAGHRCGIRLAESRRTASTHHPVARTAVAPVGDAAAIRSVMDDYVGVVRNDTDLTTAINILTSLPKASAFNAATLDATNMAWAGLAIARAAQQRSESLGCHRRSDDVAATTTNYHYAGA